MLIDNMKYDRMLSYCVTGINFLKIQASPARAVLLFQVHF